MVRQNSMTTFRNDLSLVVPLCWIIFILDWSISALFVKKSLTKQGPGWVIWRVVLALIVIVFVRFDKSGALSFFRFSFQSFFSFLIPGSVLTVLGLFGAVWARFYLGRNWSGYATYKENQTLVTTGPYRYVRHPIYTSMILMFIGTILYYGALFISIFFVILGISFILRTRKEEEIMIKLFGEKYTEYMKRTKRLIPFIY
jgi:protein-S-isoprenylcysteine O-methyltransferase Ste14